MNKKKIAILYICTGQYYELFESFYESAKKYFLTDHDKTFFVWSDTKPPKKDDIIHMPKKWKPYPHALMWRYTFFLEAKEQLKDYDYCFFFNANMICLNPIYDEDVIPTDTPFVAAEQLYQFRISKEERFESIKTKFWTNCPKSPAFIPLQYWKDHPDHCWLMGGFNGGKSKDWIEMSEQIDEWVRYNYEHGLYLKWHDEPFMNKYMIDHGVRRLNPYGFLNWYPSTWKHQWVRLGVRQKKEVLSTNFRVRQKNTKSLLDRIKNEKKESSSN